MQYTSVMQYNYYILKGESRKRTTSLRCRKFLNSPRMESPAGGMQVQPDGPSNSHAACSKPAAVVGDVSAACGCGLPCGGKTPGLHEHHWRQTAAPGSGSGAAEADIQTQPWWEARPGNKGSGQTRGRQCAAGSGLRAVMTRQPLPIIYYTILHKRSCKLLFYIV